MSDVYRFRREDDGLIIEVDFATAIKAVHGWITLEDGVSARRVHDEQRSTISAAPKKLGSQPIISDNLGFFDYQYDDFEKDRKANGFTDVEFVRDPSFPHYYQVRCDSYAARDRYAKHQQDWVDRGPGGGWQITQQELDRAAAFVQEKYGCPNTTT